jgi:hypothetical protein
VVSTIWRRGAPLLVIVLASMLTSACSPAPESGNGLVVGGVDPCNGLAIAPQTEQYAAATVTVREGHISWVPAGPGSSTMVLPKVVSARQSVSTNGLYRFSLAPGDYVLEAQFPPPANVTPVTTVTVKSGATAIVDIPNECK